MFLRSARRGRGAAEPATVCGVALGLSLALATALATEPAAAQFTRPAPTAEATPPVATPPSGSEARPFDPKREKARLALFADRESYAPGATVRLAAVVTITEGWHLQAHVPTYDYLIPTVLTLELPAGWGEAQLDYPAPHPFKFAFAEDELDVYEGEPRILASFVVPPETTNATYRVAARFRYQACDDKSCVAPVETDADVAIVVGEEGAVANAESFAQPTESPRPAAKAPSTAPTRGAAAPPISRATVLLFALLGGLILNGMPCVLPILSLKLFGLVKASGQSRGAIRAGALATTAGILVSFWALAGAAVAAKAAGAAIGWGVQFQQPGFVAFLAVVVLLFALNLWGLFEIPLPARLARLGDSGGEGFGGHFASGLFSTLLATPCSAPFLGTALSFALGQSAGTIFLVLTAVGVGLALPYLLLAAAPAAASLLPRPGAWMDTLRGALGFVLAGAVVWLLFVLAAQIDSVSVALFEVGLLLLALLVWIRHRRHAAGKGTAVAWVLVAAAAIAIVAFATRAPKAERTSAPATEAGVAWIPYDRAEAERLAASGRLVFLDITADWCVTCKVNERVILNSAEVVAAFRDREIVAMKADWTNRNDEIARFLADHGRYGIPFYMLYRPGEPPHVFPELLSKEIVLSELRRPAS